MTLPTEPIGSVARPPALQAAMVAAAHGRIGPDALEAAFDEAVADTLSRVEATGLNHCASLGMKCTRESGRDGIRPRRILEGPHGVNHSLLCIKAMEFHTQDLIARFAFPWCPGAPVAVCQFCLIPRGNTQTSNGFCCGCHGTELLIGLLHRGG